MELKFPLEFVVHGTPVSLQSTNPRTREEWKALVKDASRACLPDSHFATDRPLAITLYYFPEDVMVGDVDNMVKLVVDALKQHIYLDDRQIERIVVQKFERHKAVVFSNPSEVLTECMLGKKPALYIRITDDPREDL